ncbi:ATP-binding protein [Streptomyces sp. NPDC002076]
MTPLPSGRGSPRTRAVGRRRRGPGRSPCGRVGCRGWDIRVLDNGRGIPPQDRQRVMEMFTRLHRDVEGSGLGLATCPRIATAHGGALRLEETPRGRHHRRLPPAHQGRHRPARRMARNASPAPEMTARRPAGKERPPWPPHACPHISRTRQPRRSEHSTAP